MRLLDRPIIWIVIFGFLTAFVWEALQMPFYAMDHLSHRQMTMPCALASIADAGLMALAYGLALRFGSPGVSNPMPLLIMASAVSLRLQAGTGASAHFHEGRPASLRIRTQEAVLA